MAHNPPSDTDVSHPSEASPHPPLDPHAVLSGLRPRPSAGWRERLEAAGLGSLASPARLAAAVAGALLVVGAGWWLLRPSAPPIEATLPRAEASAGAAGAAPTAGSSLVGSSTSTSLAALVVQASGAVNRPGVFHLAGSSRVDDLVRAAGGLAPDADADRVNLAAPLADGQRIWIPRRGEAQPPVVVAGVGGPSAAGSGTGVGSGGSSGTSAPPAVVDLNTATAEQFETLPGVGPATAAAILGYRDQHGRFSSVDDLLEVRGIGDAKLEAIRPSVTV